MESHNAADEVVVDHDHVKKDDDEVDEKTCKDFHVP